MTPTSLLPKIAAGAGYDYDKLVEAILAGARLHAGGVRAAAGAAAEPVARVDVPARRRAAGGGKRL
jgi:hypothetical protein